MSVVHLPNIEITNYDPVKTAENCTFDMTAAKRAINFYPKFLKHCKGEFGGQPFELLPYQQDMIGTLFGWKRLDGTRRYRTASWFIPRGNGKSSLASGIALYMLLSDGEYGAEIYSVATSAQQARIVFDTAKEMIRQSPELSERLVLYEHAITYPAKNGIYKALSAETTKTGKSGLNSSCIIFDEIHELPNRKLWDVMRTSTVKRKQPLLIAITTAGENKHSVAYQEYEYNKKIIDGTVKNASHFPICYEALVDDDWQNEATWRKANPSYGISVSASTLKDECQKAIDSPAYENNFKRYFLNIWSEHVDKPWLKLAHWDAAETYDESLLLDQECIGGLDLSAWVDLTAFVLMFKLPDNKLFFKPYFWIPEQAIIEREARDGVPFSVWAKQGNIFLTPGHTVERRAIYEFLQTEIAPKYKVKAIAFDRFLATETEQTLTAMGFKMLECGMGFYTMDHVSKEFEARVLEGQILHNNHPVLRWNARNVTIDINSSGSIKPCKERSNGKIDGIVAALMAMAADKFHTQIETSVYENRGILVL